MAIAVFPARASQKAVVAGTDRVLASFALPAGAKLDRLWLKSGCIASSISFIQAVMYGVDAYILPQLDPDTAKSQDDIWDAQVPKDDAVGSDVIDLDTGATDTTPAFEPGDPSVSDLVKLTTAPLRVFKRRRLLTFADRAAGFESATPDTFIPAELWKSEKNLSRIDEIPVPSWLLIGMSSPGTLRTGTVEQQMGSVADWAQLQYMGYTIERMMIQLVGLTEAGAESPFEDAANLLTGFLQQFIEETAGSFAPVTWTAFTEATLSMTLRGDLRQTTLSAGGVT